MGSKEVSCHTHNVLGGFLGSLGVGLGVSFAGHRWSRQAVRIPRRDVKLVQERRFLRYIGESWVVHLTPARQFTYRMLQDYPCALGEKDCLQSLLCRLLTVEAG